MTIEEILAGESKNVEFKENLPEKSIKYMKSVVAFANGTGGKIIFGIADKTREVVGFDKEDVFKKMDAIANAVSDSCEPAIIPDITLQTVDGKTVIVVEVSEGRQRPYYIKALGRDGGVYVRVAGTTRLADEYMVKELLFEGSNRYYDQALCTGLNVTDEDIDVLCKGMDVVYIYHDTIDEASHTSDTAVFAACDKAISELKNLVRIIVNEFGGTNILITADHGFLYTYSPLKEEDKVDKRGFFDVNVTNSDITKKESIKRCVEYGRRYAIMQKGVQPDYLMPVKFLGGNTEFDGFAPRESIRIKMNGGGMNFVHGGISLQEMVVPVIEYHYLRNDSMEYRRNKQKYDTKPVTVNLLSANRKISNMIFSLNFYQKDAVSTNREAAIYQVYFTDEDGKQISDIQKIIADKTSDNGAERTFRCQFNLKSLKYSNTATYYLVIADEQGLQMPQREPFQIDIAFAVDEFDFFS